MFKNKMEKIPNEKESGGFSRREFLKAAGKAAVFGLGAFVFGIPRSEGAVSKSEAQEKTKPEVKPEDIAAREKEIIEAVSQKLAILEKALPEYGKNFSSEHISILGLQVGEPYKDGEVAWFTVYGPTIVGLEEWSRTGENEFNMRYLRFRFNKAEDKYTLGHWTWGETIVPVTSAHKEIYEEPLDPSKAEYNEKLNHALDILIKEFNRSASQ